MLAITKALHVVIDCNDIIYIQYITVANDIWMILLRGDVMSYIEKEDWLSFRMTAEEEQAEINRLHKRIQRCKCKYCGSQLELRKLTYSSFALSKLEVFCKHCNRIEYGTESEIFEIAEYYVDELGFDYFKDLEGDIRKREMNVAKVSEIIEWGCKNLGLINEDGFLVALNLEKEKIGEAMLFTDEEL